MICSAITVKRLLNTLPSPRHAALADVGHVAAMLTRARLTPDHDAQLTTRVEELRAWADHADRHHATANRKPA